MTDRLAEIELAAPQDAAPAPEIEQERRVAVFDLLEANHFRLQGEAPRGPYLLRLSLDGNRLGFALSASDGRDAGQFRLAIGQLRQIVKDYTQLCRSYTEAVRTQPPAEIERLDEARRAIHHEGARVLRQALDGKAETDTDTARRLFTLVCAMMPAD